MCVVTMSNKHIIYSFKFLFFKKKRLADQIGSSHIVLRVYQVTVIRSPKYIHNKISIPQIIRIGTTVARRVLKGCNAETRREKVISPNCATFILSASISERKASESASALVATPGWAPASGTAQTAETSAAAVSSAAGDGWGKRGRRAWERRRSGRRSAMARRRVASEAAREAMV